MRWSNGLTALLLVGCGALSACGPGSSYARARDCRIGAGPEPDAAGRLFGLAGALYMAAQPEHQQWTDQIGACMAASKRVAASAP